MGVVVLKKIKKESAETVVKHYGSYLHSLGFYLFGHMVLNM